MDLEEVKDVEVDEDVEEWSSKMRRRKRRMQRRRKRRRRGGGCRGCGGCI